MRIKAGSRFIGNEDGPTLFILLWTFEIQIQGLVVLGTHNIKAVLNGHWNSIHHIGSDKPIETQRGYILECQEGEV